MLAIFYEDSQYAYTSIPFNHPVYIKESDQSLNPILVLISVGVSLYFVVLFVMAIYYRVKAKYFPSEEKSKRRNKDQGFIE